MRWLLTILTFIMASHARAEIIVGVAGPMSGTYAAFGAQMLTGAQAAIDDLNAKGGIEGELIEIVSADDACDNRQAEVAAKSLVTKNVSVVIGHFCTYPSLAGAKIYEAAGIPIIAPSASLPVLTEQALSNVFRLAARDDEAGAFAARKLSNMKVALLSDGSKSAELLTTKFSQASVIPPALSLTFKPDISDTTGLVRDVKAANAAAIYCACSASDAGIIIAALRAAKIDAEFYGPDALLVQQFWEKSGAAGEGAIVSFAVDPHSYPEAKSVLRSLADAKIESGGAVLPSYAAVQVFAASAEAKGALNGREISSFLRSGISVPSIFGTLRFDQKGDVIPQRFVWYKWSKGKYALMP